MCVFFIYLSRILTNLWNNNDIHSIMYNRVRFLVYRSPRVIYLFSDLLYATTVDTIYVTF